MVDITRFHEGGIIPTDADDEPTRTVHDVFDDFARNLEGIGLIINGQIRETDATPIRLDDERGKGKTGWYYFRVFRTSSGNEIGYGTFGNWRTGEKYEYSSAGGAIDEVDRLAIEARRRELVEQYERERRANQDAAAEKAVAMVANAPACISHPYLDAKGVKAYGLHQAGADLIIPMRTPDGLVRSFQRIKPDGSKKYLYQGQRRGVYHVIDGDKSTIYIAEGYATAATIHELTGSAVAVAFDTGGLKPTLEAIRRFHDGPIVIAADNDRFTKEPIDNPGLTKATEAASGDPLTSVIYPEFTQDTGTDFNDLAAVEGVDVAAAQLGGTVKTERKTHFTFDGHFGELTPPDWQIDGIVERNTLAEIFGPSGEGKSFVVLDMGLSVAAGVPWQGRDTKPGIVLYVCGEGRRGVIKRIAGWKKFHGVDRELPFAVSDGSVPLTDPERLIDILAIIRDDLPEPPAMVIVDTVARNFGVGDENSTQDMGRFVVACDAIRKASEASVVLVHHTGLQDQGRARGNSSLKAALDTEIAVEQISDTPTRRIKCTKQKDADPFSPIEVDFEVVDLGEIDGVAVNTVVPNLANDPDSMGAKVERMIADKASGKNRQAVLRWLHEQRVTAQTNRPELENVLVEWKSITEFFDSLALAPNRKSEMKRWLISENYLRQINEKTYEINNI